MGQYPSTPKLNAGVQQLQPPPQKPGFHLESLREEQLDQLCTKLARLADALTLVESSHSECDDITEAPPGGADESALARETRSPSSASTSDFPLQHFTQAHLAGYQLGDEALTKPFQLIPDQPPSTALAFLGRDTALSVLDLSYNCLTSAIMKPLLQAIVKLPMLTVLRLSGNALGSAEKHPDTNNAVPFAARGGESNDDALSLVNDYSSGEMLNFTQTPAAQLGRWLATNPPLQELCLYQCGLNDYDVHVLLRGLVHPDDTTASSSLVTLQLAGNPACTWRSAKMVLQLVRDLGNQSLRVVELESAPPNTAVRFEYACTPDGHFRSGQTLISQLDQAQGATAATAVPQRMLKELTPGQVARFRSRRRHLRRELDGTRVLLPAVMGELHTILSARRAAADAAAAVSDTSVDTPAPREITPDEVQPKGAEAEIKGSDDNSCEMMEDAAVAESNGNAVNASVVEEAPLAADADGTFPNKRDASNEKPPSRLVAPPPFLTGAQRRQMPHERRAARFETPERITRVMAEARAYRHHIHPLQVDTRTPPCSDVHTHSTSGLYGSGSAAATWYTQEGFVLRPNGMSKVLVAPVLSGAASTRRNVALEEMEDPRLQACWCTPHNATSAANYAGTLHYHCVREGDPVRHKGGDAVAAVSARKAQEKKMEAAAATAAAAGSTQLPPLAAAESPAAAAESPLRDGEGSGPRTYLACCGTGHSCLSASVAMCGPRHSQRMRTMLLTQSLKHMPSSPSLPAGGARPGTSGGGGTSRLDTVVRHPIHARSSSASFSSSRASGGFGHRSTASMKFGGKRAAHSAGNGLSVAPHFNPMAFFAGQHVPCAAGIQVEEGT